MSIMLPQFPAICIVTLFLGRVYFLTCGGPCSQLPCVQHDTEPHSGSPGRAHFRRVKRELSSREGLCFGVLPDYQSYSLI